MARKNPKKSAGVGAGEGSTSKTPDGDRAHSTQIVKFKLISFLKVALPAATAIIVALLGIVYVNYPAPELPLPVRFWRDSGYHFAFKNFTIFYQDIPRLKPFSLGPVLLIIHGFPTSSYDWKKIVFGLHEQYSRVILVDMLGFGFSDKPINYDYTVEEQAMIHEAVLEHLQIKDIHIMAHDFGDTVAQELISRYQKRLGDNNNPFNIHSLCLSNGGMLPDAYYPRLIQKLLLVPVLGNWISRFSNYKIYERNLLNIFGPTTKLPVQEIFEHYSILRYKEGNLVLPKLLNYLNERQVHNMRWLEVLNKTSFPIHFIYGPRDPINPEHSARLLKGYLPKISVSVLRNAGHYPQMELPQKFLAAYQSFYKKRVQ